ncbi:MAG: FimV/HubP family polar landmark protein [Pseudomonadota bacterium]
MRFSSKAGKAAVGLLLTAALSSLAVLAQAQGLGEITLDSSLNEPLQAHIDLLDVGSLDPSQITAVLASPEEFQMAGLERSSLLTSLQFVVEKQDDGTGRIVVSSTSDINEPYLNFLISVTWPTGRALREYTLLLDLPTASTAPSPNNTSIAPPVASSTTSSSPRSADETPAPAATPAGSSDEYVVKSGDSVYQIAEQTRPSSDVSVQQMMLAIQRANEDAFVNNNINRILTGKVLRIPTPNEIGLIDQAAAVAQINQQNQELTSQPLAVNDTAGNAPATPRDELTLLSGNQAGGSSDLNASLDSLENDLMLSEEGLDRARLENLELTNRLAALQEEIDLLQNIIAIEDERIAQLQVELGKQSAATQQALASAETAAAEASDSASSGGLADMLKNSVVLLGALLAVALAAAAALFIRRRNAEADVLESNVALAAIDDADEEKSGGIAAVLASLMARFRRNSDNDEVIHEEPAFEAAPVAAVMIENKPAAPAPANTDKLLDEMGFGEEFQNLNSVLDEVEEEGDDLTAAEEAAVAMAATDDEFVAESDASAVAEASSAMEEAALLDQALNEAEMEEAEEDFLQATPAAVATAPESFAFTSEPVAEEEEAELAEVAATDEKPDVFEFTLPSIDDTATVTEPAEAEDKLETFSFTSSIAEEEPVRTPTAAAINEVEDALEVLSFDEDAISLDDAGEDTASYDTNDTQTVHDARLDLAVAYEAMGDLDGAIEILDEVIATGKAPLMAEANRLKLKWQNG